MFSLQWLFPHLSDLQCSGCIRHPAWTGQENQAGILQAPRIVIKQCKPPTILASTCENNIELMKPEAGGGVEAYTKQCLPACPSSGHRQYHPYKLYLFTCLTEMVTVIPSSLPFCAMTTKKKSYVSVFNAAALPANADTRGREGRKSTFGV